MEDKRDKGYQKNEIYSQRVKAGKRTYFFDVKSTKSNDFYLTITESKRKPKDDGDGFYYEKHKIFLYKEDFQKFLAALNDTLRHVADELLPEEEISLSDDNYEAPAKKEIDGEEYDELEDYSFSSEDSDLKWDE